MRVVAGETRDTLVVDVEALAIGQAIGLEANIAGTVRPVLSHIVPGTVALAAELRAVFGVHSSQLLHLEELCISLFQPSEMVFGRSMAMLALHAGLQCCLVQFSVVNGSGGVAAKAGLNFVQADSPANAFVEGGRMQRLVPYRDVEAIESFVITHKAFDKISLVFENVSLSGFAEAKGVSDWESDGGSSVGNGVQALLALALNGVCERSNASSHQIVLPQDAALGHRFGRMRHRRAGMQLCLSGMTARTFAHLARKDLRETRTSQK